MENVYKIIHVAIALIILALLIGIFASTVDTERFAFKEASADFSEAQVRADGVVQSNFNEEITGSELKYALKHDKELVCTIDNVEITSTNRENYYYSIRNTDVYSAKLNNNVWEFTRSPNNPPLSEAESEDLAANINSQPPRDVATVNKFKELETHKAYCANELYNIIAESDSVISFLFTGAFGNFSCAGGDTSQLQDFVDTTTVGGRDEIFYVEDSSLNDLQQVSIRIDEEIISSEFVMNKYFNKLVYGNNLVKVLQNIEDLPISIIEDGKETYITMNDTRLLERTSIYCVYRATDHAVLKNSDLSIGIIAYGSSWDDWRHSCNDSWEYSIEPIPDNRYRMTSYSYNPLGILTEVNLELTSS